MFRSRLRGCFSELVAQLFDDCCLCHASVKAASSAGSGRSSATHEAATSTTRSPCLAGRRAPICQSCLSWFTATDGNDELSADALCLACGTITDHAELFARRCDRCLSTPTAIDRIVAPFRYQWPVDRLVGQLKYHEKRHLAPLFGTLLAQEVLRLESPAREGDERCAGGSALLLPVPLHPARRAARGFNQADDIAHWCGRALSLEVRSGWVRRVEDTGSLASTGRAERELVIRGAFAVDAAVSGRAVVLIDDVLTTGATTAELARECLDTGAASVEVWAVARTVARAEVSMNAPPAAS